MIHFYVSNSPCKGTGGPKMNHIYMILYSGGFEFIEDYTSFK
jgi:hypothetical protein